jgi:hypothetical protein
MSHEGSDNESGPLDSSEPNVGNRHSELDDHERKEQPSHLFPMDSFDHQDDEAAKLSKGGFFHIESMFNYPTHPSSPLLHSNEQTAPAPSNSAEKVPKTVLTHNVNLFKIATVGTRQAIGMNPALSKPSFCPTHNTHFVCGTEEQDPYKRTSNVMIFASIDENIVNVRFTYPVTDYVRDLQWIDTQHIVFAINQKLGLVRMTPELTVDAIVMFPEFHKDAIREISVSTGNKNLVISGGFDGNVFVTDISRLCSDIEKQEKKSENSLYPCRDVVGSVSWHPEDSYLASCTTDTGTLHIFDIRTDKRRPAIVYDSGKKELYTHAYKDSHTMLLGYGDGSVHVFDTRSKRTLMQFHDPHQKQIGEIRFDYNTKNFAIFGTPEFTLWGYNDAGMTLCSHHQMADTSIYPMYKTSGEFRKGTKTVGVTDSTGTFALFDFSGNA